MLTSALWFFGGVILHKVLSKLLSVNDARYVLQEAEDAVIILLDAVDRDVYAVIAKKHKALLEDEEIDEKDAQKIIESDIKFLLQWKTYVLSKMILASPKKYFKYFRHLTWESSLVRLAELKDNIDSLKEGRNVD